MSGIFISYRREDGAAYARLLCDRLGNHFGKDNVFMDVDSIEPGVDFVEVLEGKISICDAVVVVIGKQWLTATDSDGRRRLDNPEDLVRVEVAAALERKIRVVPALVGGARMPSGNELPKAIESLSRRHAQEIKDDRLFHQSVTHLIEALDKSIGKAQPLPASVPGQLESLPPVLPINNQSAIRAEERVARFLTWLLLLYKPQGDPDWVSWAFLCRTIFLLSSLSWLVLFFLEMQLNLFVIHGFFAWCFFVAFSSRLAGGWCDVRALKTGSASQTEDWNAETPYLYVPGWRRIFLLYLPRGASGWVLLSWTSRLLILVCGFFSLLYLSVGVIARSALTDPEFWAILSGFTGGTVLLRFIASWFDKLAARGQRLNREPALSSRQDAEG